MPNETSTVAEPPRSSVGKGIGRIFGVLLLLFLGVFIGRYIIPATQDGVADFSIVSSNDGNRQLVFPTFWEAWDKLHGNYLEKLDDKDLFYGAVEGMVRAAGDPYTAFSDPEETKQFQETLTGRFSGIGVEIGLRNGLVTVIAPLKGSPAEKAGIFAEDIVVAVDSEPITQEMSLDDVVQRIRGPRGEEVVLTIARRDEDQTQDITVVRDEITIESATVTFEDNIAHVELSSFNGDTTQQFTNIAKQIQEQRPLGIIVDMRNNPGGYLQTSVDLASFFLQPGTVVVSEKGKEEKVYKTKGGALFQDTPVVVLVNKGSASASEILAGALQDNRNTPVVGVTTFGKGSVQELISLKDGSSLRVTVAKWYTPKGNSISDEGIKPTVEVEDNRDTDEDEQLQRAKEELQRIVGNPTSPTSLGSVSGISG